LLKRIKHDIFIIKGKGEPENWEGKTALLAV
jgi:hypothetical protein